MTDSFTFRLDEESEKRLYDLLTEVDVKNTKRFWIQDKRGYHAEYVKVIRCNDCRLWKTEDCYMCNSCKVGTTLMTESDFCSRAERKEE